MEQEQKQPEQSKEVVVAEKTNAVAAPVDEQALAEIRELGGASTNTKATFPRLRLEHTTDINGDPNPLRGHFTAAEPDALGNWKTVDLGTEIKGQIVLQRYYLKLTKENGKKTYSTAEFDHENDHVKLFEATGQGEERRAILFGEGTAEQLGRAFMVTKTFNGRERKLSELILLYVVYILIDGKMYKWKMNTSATFSYRGYQKRVTPFTVVTKVTANEKKNGSNKFYAPAFEAVEQMTNFKEILNAQKELRAVVGQTVALEPDGPVTVENEGASLE